MWKNGRENKPAKRGKMVEKMTLSANEFWRRNFVLKDLELNHSLKTFRFGQNLAMAMEIPYGSFNPHHQKKKKKPQIINPSSGGWGLYLSVWIV
jgi:hypothetical protein